MYGAATKLLFILSSGLTSWCGSGFSLLGVVLVLTSRKGFFSLWACGHETLSSPQPPSRGSSLMSPPSPTQDRSWLTTGFPSSQGKPCPPGARRCCHRTSSCCAGMAAGLMSLNGGDATWLGCLLMPWWSEPTQMGVSSSGCSTKAR